MNAPTSFFQKLILPIMILIMMSTGFLIFKKNPEIMNQSSLLSKLKENAEDNELAFVTHRMVESTPVPVTTLPHHMTHRLFLAKDGAEALVKLVPDHFSAFLVGTMVLAHDSSSIVAISTDTGDVQWRFDAPANVTFADGPVAILGGHAVAGTEQGGLYAFNLSDGQLLWYWQESEKFMAMPVAYNGDLLLFPVDKSAQEWSIEKFSPSEMSTKSSIGPFDAPLAGTPLLSGNLFIFATASGHLQAVDLDKEKTKWSTEGSSNFTCPPVLQGERIYICNEDGFVLAYDQKSGRHAGQIEVGSKIVSRLAMTDTPIVPIATGISQQGDLVAIDLKQQKRLWKFYLGNSSLHFQPHQIMLTQESLRQLKFVSEDRGWTVWTGCHDSKVCIFDLKKGVFLHRLDLKGGLAANFLLAREDLALAPVRSGSNVVIERWSTEPKPGTAPAPKNAPKPAPKPTTKSAANPTAKPGPSAPSKAPPTKTAPKK